MKTLSVYAIMAEGLFIKFGVTANFDKRIACLQEDNPLKLKPLHVSDPLPRALAFSVEKVIHKAAVAYHVKGEWFKSCPKTLAIVELLKTKPLDELSEILNKWGREELRFLIKAKMGPHNTNMFDRYLSHRS